MNKVFLIGRLTAAPELRTTTNGKSVSEFTIAVDRYKNGEKDADFIRCTAWDKQADNLTRYQRQGDKIAVIGSLRVEKYEDVRGNKKYKTYVQVSEIEFLSTKAARDHENGQIPDEANNDDLPF